MFLDGHAKRSLRKPGGEVTHDNLGSRTESGFHGNTAERFPRRWGGTHRGRSDDRDTARRDATRASANTDLRGKRCNGANKKGDGAPRAFIWGQRRLADIFPLTSPHPSLFTRAPHGRDGFHYPYDPGDGLLGPQRGCRGCGQGPDLRPVHAIGQVRPRCAIDHTRNDEPYFVRRGDRAIMTALSPRATVPRVRHRPGSNRGPPRRFLDTPPLTTAANHRR